MVHKLITVHTRVCGFVGDPISHSIGPDILKAAFKELGLDYVYIAFRVIRERFAEAIAGIRALNIKGLNVTKPHKVTFLPLLDDIDELALKIGAPVLSVGLICSSGRLCPPSRCGLVVKRRLT
ncbi:shikimate dehydrogenase family protein [Chloroflexota bacterium]